MKSSKPFLASLAMAVIMAAVSLWALSRLPDAPIPAHWAIDGRPDRYASPASVLFILPAAVVVMSLMFAIIPKLMPPRGDLTRSRTAYETTWLSAVALLLVVHLTIIAKTMGADIDIPRIIAIGVGGLMMVIGNVLPKTRFNYVMGIRTPWTLADERVWDRTHRFGGIGLFIAGVVIAIGGLVIGDDVVLIAVILAPILLWLTASVAYSAAISPRVGRSGPAL